MVIVPNTGWFSGYKMEYAPEFVLQLKRQVFLLEALGDKYEKS